MTAKKERETIQVRVLLEGELLEKVEAIRKYYGLVHYADLVRLLFNEKYNQLPKVPNASEGA